MIIACPACNTRFRVGDDQIGPNGRKMRCGKCQHEWVEQPPAAPSAAPSEPAPVEPPDPEALGAQDAPAEAPPPAEADTSVPPPPTVTKAHNKANQGKPIGDLRRRKKRSRAIVGWIIFVLLFGSLAAGFLAGREVIMEKAPVTAKLYALIGLGGPPPGEGLQLENVRSVRRLVGEERHLFVQGEIVNIADGPRQIPILRVAFIDSSGNELHAWTFEAVAKELPAGESSPFQTSVKDPPEGAANLTVDFVLDP